jgi:uncharacterized protein YqgC (DUF456 family)
MSVVGAILLLLVALILWALNFLSLPGNWLVLLAAGIYAYFIPSEMRTDVSWWALSALLVLAVLGELIEFAAGAVGTAKAGGSRRGAALAVVGSLMGGIFGLFVALPIPLVGPILGALLFGGLGALGGAVLGEQWKGKDLDESLRIGQAAFWGRLFGTLGKVLAGAVMLAVLLVAFFVYDF